MFDQPTEQFTDQEIALLRPFVTNVDRPIFCLRNLPEVVKGALFARYSRSTKSLRRLLLDEFINEPASGFAAIVSAIGDSPAAQLIAARQAEAFYDRVLIGYGDDSVAELGGAHLACEGISNIAAKLLEDRRIGISPLEKSTRYVRFDLMGPHGYRYLREPAIMASVFAQRYVTVMDQLFTTYSAILPLVQEWLQQRFPRDEATSLRAYRNTIQAKALDLLRGLLPMATQTNVGLFGNGRAFEYLIIKLRASPLAEAQALADAIQTELDQVIPAFVKRARSDRGQAYAAYLASTHTQVAAVAERLRPITERTSASDQAVSVQLVEYDPDAEWKLAAAVLYPHLDLPLTTVRDIVASLTAAERQALIAAAVGERTSRFHRPGRAFEEPYYTFDILADIGAYRDLQRHRMLTQDRQRFTVMHGYSIPSELEQIGVADRYRAALEQAAELVTILEPIFPNEAQYAVPFAFRMRWRIKLNLREAYHLIELRSARQGHPTYRRIAQMMFHAIQSVHPTLAAGMQFVDHNEYDLERLAAEQRLDQKRRVKGEE